MTPPYPHSLGPPQTILIFYWRFRCPSRFLFIINHYALPNPLRVFAKLACLRVVGLLLFAAVFKAFVEILLPFFVLVFFLKAPGFQIASLIQFVLAIVFPDCHQG